MLVSISKSASDDLSHHCYFKTAECKTMRDLAAVSCGRVQWSPIVWKDGERKKANFVSCDVLVLDFDDGKISAEEFTTQLRLDSIRFVLGTTLNHQKLKNNVVCDRFRVMIPFSETIRDLETHQQNMRRILSAFPCDQACFDGARMYRPCFKIYSWGDGDAVPVLPYVPTPPPTENTRMRHRLMYASRRLPDWIVEALASNNPGGRNQLLFRVAAKLTEYGYDETTVLDMIRSSAADLPIQEKENVGRNGIRAAKVIRS